MNTTIGSKQQTRTFEVWHKQDGREHGVYRFDPAEPEALAKFTTFYRKVGTVVVVANDNSDTDLDAAYESTQNGARAIEDPALWSNRPNVTAELPQRSTSVGDVFVDAQSRRSYAVARFGFTDVTDQVQ